MILQKLTALARLGLRSKRTPLGRSKLYPGWDNVDASSDVIDAYVFYSPIAKWQREEVLEGVIAEGKLAYKQLANQPVFLKIERALKQQRFIDPNHLLLKVHVATDAIIGTNTGLVLKGGVIGAENIEGCYPGWLKSQMFFRNACFNIAATLEKFQHHNQYA